MGVMPKQVLRMDVKDHPANNIPNATDHHDGTVINPQDIDENGKLPKSLNQLEDEISNGGING